MLITRELATQQLILIYDFPTLEPAAHQSMADGGRAAPPANRQGPVGPRLAERAFWKTALLSNSNAAVATRQTLDGAGGSVRSGREGRSHRG